MTLREIRKLRSRLKEHKPSSTMKCPRQGIKLVETNYDEVIRMIRNEPLKGRIYFYENSIQKNISVAKELIKEIRKELSYNF